MMNFMIPAVTADEVTNGFSDALFDIFDGAWNIVAPFAGATLVIFLIILLLRHITGRRR
jgi:hypothetical protein